MKKIASRKNRLPEWFLQDIPDSRSIAALRFLRRQRVNTVCLESRCPNWAGCFNQKCLAFMLLGSRCTRSCAFCAVERLGRNRPPADRQEPQRILRIIKELGLNFVVITSVCRDDLDDKGAGEFVRTIKIIRDYKASIEIEVLIPDFLGESLNQVVKARPDVLGHNLETVERLYPKIRPEAAYRRSLKVIALAKSLMPGLVTKSSLLLGLGETEEEVVRAMLDLRICGCDILVLGQYLAPTQRHYAVREFISIEQFQRYKQEASRLGFAAIQAAPLARTSYRAEQVYHKIKCAG
ncbi:lipoyl synthase [Candidatus Omnitrophota bacterium]